MEVTIDFSFLSFLLGWQFWLGFLSGILLGAALVTGYILKGWSAPRW